MSLSYIAKDICHDASPRHILKSSGQDNTLKLLMSSCPGIPGDTCKEIRCPLPALRQPIQVSSRACSLSKAHAHCLVKKATSRPSPARSLCPLRHNRTFPSPRGSRRCRRNSAGIPQTLLSAADFISNNRKKPKGGGVGWRTARQGRRHAAAQAGLRLPVTLPRPRPPAPRPSAGPSPVPMRQEVERGAGGGDDARAGALPPKKCFSRTKMAGNLAGD